MKKFILLALMAIVTMGAYAQKEQTVTIKTNASLNCDKCANRFKENVPFFKGVSTYTYDKATGVLTINYNDKKTSPDQLRQQISKLGYNADNVPADAAAREKLPACCKGGSCSDHAQGSQHQCQGHANGQQHQCQGHANGEQQKCQGANGEQHKCSGAANGQQHQCQGHANGQQKSCQGANGEQHKCSGQCQGHANGQQKSCQGANGQHQCQGHANGEQHKCSGQCQGHANGEQHKCQHSK